MSWSDFLSHIGSHHLKLEHLLGTGIGLKFQRVDSDIVAETRLHFAESGIPVLPVHDSFIMHHGHEDALGDLIVKALKAKTESDIPIKATRKSLQARPDRIAYQAEQGLYKDYDPANTLHEVSTDLDILLSYDPE